MPIRIQVPSTEDKTRMFVFALCMLLASGLLFITAWGFDSKMPTLAIYLSLGETMDSASEEYQVAVNDPNNATSTRIAASLVFSYLAYMTAFIMFTLIVVVIFDTTGILGIAVPIVLLLFLFKTAQALIACFNVGGGLFGIGIVGILIIELGLIGLFLWFVDKKYPLF
jgi:hypothetical protein